VKRGAWSLVEEALGSLGRLKIMRELLRNPRKARTRYSISRATGLKMEDVKAHLETLAEKGWVIQYPYKPRTYRPNMENPMVKLLKEFIEEVERLEVKGPPA